MVLKGFMSDVGYTVIKGSRTTFKKQLNDETTLWVSLQIIQSMRPQLGLFPRVGFNNLKVIDFFYHHLEQQRPEKLTPPMLSETLGYLMPEPRQLEWYFHPTEDEIQRTARDVIGSIVEYGTPLMTRYPDLISLAAWAIMPTNDLGAMTQDPRLLRATILYLVGDISAAKGLISESIAEVSTHGHDLKNPAYDAHIKFDKLLRLH
jgi:hypothetical protein